MTSLSLRGAQHHIVLANSALRPAHQSPGERLKMRFSAGLGHLSVSGAAGAPTSCSAEPCMLADESVCRRPNSGVPPNSQVKS